WSSWTAARTLARACGSMPLGTPSVDLLGPDALLVTSDHLSDQPLDVRVAAGANVPLLDRVDVVADVPLGGELVEVGARDCDGHPRVLRRRRLGDLWTRDLHPEHLDVSPPPELQLEDELELCEGRHLGLEALDRSPDQVLSGRHPARRGLRSC